MSNLRNDTEITSDLRGTMKFPQEFVWRDTIKGENRREEGRWYGWIRWIRRKFSSPLLLLIPEYPFLLFYQWTCRRWSRKVPFPVFILSTAHLTLKCESDFLISLPFFPCFYLLPSRPFFSFSVSHFTNHQHEMLFEKNPSIQFLFLLSVCKGHPRRFAYGSVDKNIIDRSTQDNEIQLNSIFSGKIFHSRYKLIFAESRFLHGYENFWVKAFSGKYIRS